QLQSEFAAALSIAPPEYTWAGKPSAAGNAGKEIIVTDFNRSRWYSDGTYWRPVGGEQVVHNPVLTNATASSATLQLVASVPGWQMPEDLVNTPGVAVKAFFTGHLASGPSNAQARQIYVGVTGAEGFCLRHLYTTLSTAHQGCAIAWSRAPVINEFMASAVNGGSSQAGNSGGDVSITQILAAPIRLYYQGGNPDGSEVIRFHHFRL
ncbi:hypothetical protein GXC69_12590, partial [Candidatus Macondimonas diazotrophica]|nr:hypothetical protein [Candidatus Macondimonas diazotrophica]